MTGMHFRSASLTALLGIGLLDALLRPRTGHAEPPARADNAEDQKANEGPEDKPSHEKPARQEIDDQVYFALGEVVVISDRTTGPLDSADIATSVDIVGSDQLEHENVSEPLEALRRVPAVYTDTFNQGIISADIGIRGFNTQGDVAHTKLLIDGIPSNLHIGYTDLKSVFPLEIDRMEVLKGTNDPRHGLNSVAGNVHVVTKKSGNERKIRLLAGSFGTLEPQALLGFDSGRLAQNYFAAYRRSGGYRANSDVAKAAGAGKWFFKANERLTVGLIVRSLYFHADAPGYLSAEEARSMPELSVDYSAADGGLQKNSHASLHADYLVTDTLSISLKAYGQSFRRNRWVRFDADAGQQERVEDETQYGTISVLTLRPRTRIQDLTVEWGIDYQLQDNLHQRFPTAARARTGMATRHQDFTLHALGSYLQARARPVRQVLVTGGVRADRLDGSFTDVLSGATYDINEYGTIWQPKLSAVVTPMAGHSLYANYGRTFQVGVGVGAYATQDEPLKPSINDGWEVGYKTSPVSWLSGRLSYWQQYASSEVRLKFDDSGESENVGETLRRGFDIELSISPTATVSLWAAYSRHGSEQVEPGPAFPERKGKELNHVPDFSAKGGIHYRPINRLLLGVWFYAQGDYYLTKDNDSEKYGDYALVHADLAYQLTPWAELGLQVKNLLGARYDTTVWYKDFGVTGTQHNPGDERALYVTTTAAF